MEIPPPGDGFCESRGLPCADYPEGSVQSSIARKALVHLAAGQGRGTDEIVTEKPEERIENGETLFMLFGASRAEKVTK
jgi:hypothetical protein